jgi:tRNA(Arg) A34 adenosine deaminase TadA
MSHDDFMRRAIELAKGNPKAPFGTVIVDRANGQVVAEGLN